jgi:hypothetical protein
MSLFGLNSKAKFNQYEIFKFDFIFLNIHRVIKDKFLLDGRVHSSTSIHYDSLSYGYIMGKNKPHIVCHKYYIKNYNDFILTGRNTEWHYMYINYPIKINKFPTTLYVINGEINNKRIDSFYFEFEPKLNEYGKETPVFTDDLLKDIKKKSIKLIKKLFK